MVSEYGLSWCQLHGTQNYVLCAGFLENLCACEPKYVFELLVSAECLHYKLKFDAAIPCGSFLDYICCYHVPKSFVTMNYSALKARRQQ